MQRVSVYFGSKSHVIDEFTKLSEKYPDVSVSGLIVTSCQACLDTLMIEVPKRKTFELNGHEVTME